MDKENKPIYQTTTDEGTTITIEANLPSLPTVQNFPPKNEDIDQQLESAKQTLRDTRKEADLNAKGEKIVQDVEQLIDVASTALHEKNKDEQLQKLVLDTKEAVQKTAPVLQKEGERIQAKGTRLGEQAQTDISARTTELQTDVQQLYSYIKNLLWSFLRSEDFRELASDWIGFLQFLGTKKIKEKAQEQELQREDALGNFSSALASGLEQPSKPSDEDELQQRTEDMLQDLVNRVRRKPEYQSALRDIFRLYDQLQAKMDQISTEVKKEGEQVSSSLDTDAFWKVIEDADNVFAQFGGRGDWESFKSSLNSTFYSVRDDPELRSWWVDFRSFWNDILDRPEAITDEPYKARAKELTQRGRLLLQKDKWNQQLDTLYNRFYKLLDNLQNDSTTQLFGEKLKQLGKDIAFNRKGYPDIYSLEESLVQVKNLLVPLFRQQLENISIGRIDFTNETYDVRIEDLGFSGSFLPEHIDFAMRNDTHLDTKDSSKDEMRNILAFQVDNIKPEFKSFKFYYRRKTFPKIEDFGVADMKISGKGALLRVTWRIASKAGSKPVATLTDVTVYIDKLDLHIIGERTKHDVLDKMLAPFVARNIKDKISASLEDYLRSKLNDVNRQLNSLLQSSPVETLKERANESLQEGYQKLQEQRSVSAV
jgi:hypothetical protein